MAIAYILSFCEVIQPVVSRLQILLSQPSIGAECIDLCVIVAAAHMPLRCRKSLPSRWQQSHSAQLSTKQVCPDGRFMFQG